jgi:hypothetical protein
MRVPVSFECRPTARNLLSTSLPDELMIDWVGVPSGATASIFLPAASADDIVRTAGRLYGAQRLTRSDAHTVECDASNVTYVPIPAGSGSDFAGLLTLDVPSGFRKSARCKVIARQVTNATTSRDIAVRRPQIRRKVLGSFQLTVPVGTAQALLEPEERLLAFFRWILSTLGSGDRWRPVIERYVSEIVLRVKEFGGDPSAIPPSQVGAIPSKPPPGAGPIPVAGGLEKTGKIEGLLYDRFGDFEGFILRPESGAKLAFRTRERHFAELAGWAWRTQTLVTIFARDHEPREAERILLHAPPGALPPFP